MHIIHDIFLQQQFLVIILYQQIINEQDRLLFTLSTTKLSNTGGRPTQSGPSYYQQTNNLNPDDGLNSTTMFILIMNMNLKQIHIIMVNHNHPKINRGLTYSTNGQTYSQPPPSQKRRVQIIDHSRHTPSTVTNGYTSIGIVEILIKHIYILNKIIHRMQIDLILIALHRININLNPNLDNL